MASPMARPTSNPAIPRRVPISDPADIPCSYSSTPGGTLYSTTPGGTKIVYERSFLMNLRNSPISKTPPRWEIPDALLKGSSPKGKDKPSQNGFSYNHKHNGVIEEEQFSLEM